MQLNFEQQKNIKASVYTLLICIVLASLFVVLQWNQTPPIITPPEPSYMEVNLGNSETGLGDIPPMSKEAPAPEVGASKQTKASSAPNALKVNASASNDENDEAIKSSKAKKNIKSAPVPTIYAEIEVSPNGIGRFVQIAKGSSSNDPKYKKAITEYLTKINFNTSDHSSMVTVKFKFEVQ